jgi:hypothetical protein
VNGGFWGMNWGRRRVNPSIQAIQNDIFRITARISQVAPQGFEP